MYAVVQAGGKQYRVAEGQRLAVERVSDDRREVELRPVLLVDGDEVLATPQQLGRATVTASVVEHGRSPKVHGFTYKSKSNQRRRWGHRQANTIIEITDITKG